MRIGWQDDKKIPDRSRCTSGTSLVEIIISVAILGIITVTFFSVFTSGYKGIADAGNRTTASRMASEIHELMYAAGSLSISDQQLDDMLTANVSGNTAIEIVPWGSSSLYEYPGINTVRLSRRNTSLLLGSDGFEVRTVVFREGGHDYVLLTSFYKGD